MEDLFDEDIAACAGSSVGGAEEEGANAAKEVA